MVFVLQFPSAFLGGSFRDAALHLVCAEFLPRIEPPSAGVAAKLVRFRSGWCRHMSPAQWMPEHRGCYRRKRDPGHVKSIVSVPKSVLGENRGPRREHPNLR